MDISLHKIKKITLDKIRVLDNFTCRTLVIEFGKDEKLKLNLFSEEATALVIKKEL